VYVAPVYATLDDLSSTEVLAVALAIGGLALWSRTRAGVAVKQPQDDGPPASSGKKMWRVASTIVFIVVVTVISGIAWVQSYNPIGQNWSSVKGEFSSYVANERGVKAHETSSTVPDQPVAELIWNEPSSRFSVQVETEVENNGPHAVRITHIGEPDFGYKVDDYRVAFYHYRSLGSEAGAPFRPFTLKGHEDRMVVITYSQPCRAAGNVSVGVGTYTSTSASTLVPGMSSLPVTYSFFGFAHTVAVPVMPYALQSPPYC
jgi:hypothetical protein